jgi:hypothetical protein
MIEDLRRTERIAVCCRAVVRDRYGTWTAVTHDVATRGCQIVTSRQLRPGARVHLTLSSDLFAEDLDVAAEVVWVGPQRLALAFLEASRRPGALTPSAWVALVLAHGAPPAGAGRTVPFVQRVERRAPARHAQGPAVAAVPAPPLLLRLPERPWWPRAAGGATAAARAERDGPARGAAQAARPE